ncbi:hypothetical protein FKW77_004932 [Venturia effusa]|uniref:ATPase inhibitor, mitochondrial n=1 Tax=Venturia effusa TaxID=50376 RepID=A0A517L5D1_9PEZI|nr:hypothetical protein FKW77_004932 [Venturia effusa]
MLRTQIAKASMPLIARRSFASTPRIMAAGDTGSGFSRPGGAASGDAFTKREKGSEDMWIRQEEQAKLHALAAKVANAQKHMEELQGYIKDLTKDEGGQGEQK